MTVTRRVYVVRWFNPHAGRAYESADFRTLAGAERFVATQLGNDCEPTIWELVGHWRKVAW